MTKHLSVDRYYNTQPLVSKDIGLGIGLVKLKITKKASKAQIANGPCVEDMHDNEHAHVGQASTICTPITIIMYRGLRVSHLVVLKPEEMARRNDHAISDALMA
ncbi:hypothetical protein CR513_05373, partial [Mucuna pruriens]